MKTINNVIYFPNGKFFFWTNVRPRLVELIFQNFLKPLNLSFFNYRPILPGNYMIGPRDEEPRK